MKQTKPVIYALMAAFLYALSTPISKLLLTWLSPTLIAGLLYLGAGIGMGLVKLLPIKKLHMNSNKFARHDIASIIGMILLDIAAPILLLLGLTMSRPESVSLLNNFEIVATSMFAVVFFKEMVSKRLLLAIVLVTLASVVLSFDDLLTFKFSWGALLVLGATLCWGLENNLTRKLSDNDPLNVVIIKGFGAGIGSLLIALALGQFEFNLWPWLGALALGALAYGYSIYLYVAAQRTLGAARTSAFYGIAPFVGALLSLIIFQQWPQINFYIGLALMALGAYFALHYRKKNGNSIKGEQPAVEQ